MSHILSNETTNFPLKAYTDNKFKSTQLAKGKLVWIRLILYKLSSSYSTTRLIKLSLFFRDGGWAAG